MDKNIIYRNPFTAPSCKPLYSQAKIDAMASTKMKTNGRHIAIPDPNTVSIGILPIASRLDHTETIKLKDHAPLMFLSPKVNDFEFSRAQENLLASTSKNDSLVRIWKIEDAYNWEQNLEIDTPICMLAGHEKRIDIVRFHSQSSEILATVSQDKTIK
jgi:coronin-1B/1C/6